MANSTVHHSNNANSTYRETHRERENGRETERENKRERERGRTRERERRERERERERERTTGLLVGFWLIEYREELPRGTASGGQCSDPSDRRVARWLVPTVAVPRALCPDRRAPAELPDSGGALPRARG